MKLIKLLSDHYIVVDDAEKDTYTVPLSEVKELLGEVDVEKKATSYCENWEFERILGTGSDGLAHDSYVAGYNQALEDNKGKVYTKEDIRVAIRLATTSKYDHKLEFYSEGDIFKSLQLPTSWDVTFVDGKLKLV